jgi:hypothetical protein
MEPSALKQFYRATRKLREIMNEDDLYLDDFDRLSLENYISLLHMTYIDWKRRNLQCPVINGKRDTSPPRPS